MNFILFSSIFISFFCFNSIYASTIETNLSNEFGHIEASGVIKVDNSFWIISDDTKDKIPEIFIADSLGKISSKKIIKSLQKINDMEGITKDENENIYISTSLSVNKSGEIKEERKILIKVSKNFELKNKINLFDKLKTSNIDFLKTAIKEKTLDIEGLAYKNNAIYLGLKAPLKNNDAVIVKIENIFEKNTKFEIYKTIKTDGGIISMEFFEDDLFIVSKSKDKKKKSILWKLDTKTDKLIHLKDLGQKRVEGLALQKDKIIFTKDGNKKASSIIFMEK